MKDMNAENAASEGPCQQCGRVSVLPLRAGLCAGCNRRKATGSKPVTPDDLFSPKPSRTRQKTAEQTTSKQQPTSGRDIGYGGFASEAKQRGLFRWEFVLSLRPGGSPLCRVVSDDCCPPIEAGAQYVAYGRKRTHPGESLAGLDR